MQIKGFEAFFVVVVLIQLQTLDCELNANLLTMTMQTFWFQAGIIIILLCLRSNLTS